MGDKRVIKATLSVGLACCLFASNAAAQSLTDRFKSLFGGSSDQPATSAPAPAPAPGTPQIDPDLVCPPVADSRRRLHLCGGRARQAAGRQ